MLRMVSEHAVAFPCESVRCRRTAAHRCGLPPYRDRERVRAALRAAARRTRGPFVRDPFFAAVLRSLALRRMAAPCACLASADRDADDRGSRFNARRTARDRLVDGFLRLRPFATSRAA
jgi:hypothetical protein